MLGTDPSISAGRFHYVSNITLAPTKSCYCSYQAQWDYLSSKPCDRNERHIFPQLKTLNIDVTELQIPKGSLLNVERILEDISDVDEVHLCGLEILPPRIAGVLRSVRYSDEQVMEDSPSIVNGNNAGQWGSVAGEMSKPSYNSTLLAWKALKSWEAQKMKDDERAIEEMMAEEGEYDDQAMEALKSCGAQKLKDDEWAIEEMMAKGSGVR
jgi:hypothetical protein